MMQLKSYLVLKFGHYLKTFPLKLGKFTVKFVGNKNSQVNSCFENQHQHCKLHAFHNSFKSLNKKLNIIIIKALAIN